MPKNRPRELASPLLLLLATGLGVAVLSYAGYVAVTWYRFGRGAHAAGQDALLDEFMPEYEVRERHEIRVAAPAHVTFAAARELDLQRSPLVRAIFDLRTLPSRWRGEQEQEQPHGFLAHTLSIGWGILAEIADHEIAVGAVTQPWEPVGQFHSLPPAEFA